MAEINSAPFKQNDKKDPPDKKVKKVISGEAKEKNNGVRRFKDVFLEEDTKTVKSFLFSDVIVPGIKNLLYDMVVDGFGMMLGQTGGSRRSSNGKSIMDYNGITRQGNRRSISNGVPAYDYRDFAIPSRGDAEEVLTQLEELISVYGEASVADFYESVGVTGNWTDAKYGWKDLRNATVVRVRDGYMIKFPRAVPLD